MEQRLDFYSLSGFRSGVAAPDDLERLTISPHKTALFIDFDGTFVDIAPTPNLIKFSNQDRELLKQLYKHFCGAVALVSGRNLANIDPYVSQFSGTMSGGHGAEMRHKGKRLAIAKCDLNQLKHIKNAVKEFSNIYPGVLVEDKSFGIVMHFREHPELEGKVRNFATGLISDDCDFEILSAKMAIEVKSKDISKAKAIERIMMFDEFRNRTVLFAGDDKTDEAAFAWINDQDGITIKIGEGLTLAQYRAENPTKFKKWLRTQLQSVGKGAS